MKNFSILLLLICLFLTTGCNRTSETKTFQPLLPPTNNQEQSATSGLDITPAAVMPTITTSAANTKNITAATTTNITVKPLAGITLDIISSKNTYAPGETVHGDYRMKYSGTPFQGIILYTFSRKGYVQEYYSLIRTNIYDLDFSDLSKDKNGQIAFNAFRLSANGYEAGTKYFYEAGTYVYTMAVYNCAVVENKLKKTCNQAEVSELQNVTPVKTTSKIISVVGDSLALDCTTDSQCATSCSSCKAGKQVCSLSNNSCVECFMDLMCADGYNCINKKCVK